MLVTQLVCGNLSKYWQFITNPELVIFLKCLKYVKTCAYLLCIIFYIIKS